MTVGLGELARLSRRGNGFVREKGRLEARFEAPRMLACVLLHPRGGIVCR